MVAAVSEYGVVNAVVEPRGGAGEVADAADTGGDAADPADAADWEYWERDAGGAGDEGGGAADLVRGGAIPSVDSAITELVVAALPLPAPRGKDAEPDADSVRRYAEGVLAAQVRLDVNRRLAELRARHRRMSPEDEGYRELFEEITGLERRRLRIGQRA